MLISLFAFAQFALAGFALTTWVVRRRDNLQLLLISPAIGAAALALVALPLSRLGLAAESYARPLLAILDVAAIAALIVRRPRLTLRMGAFALPPAIVFLFVGAPLALLGADWIAYANEDVATPLYVSQWLFAHGMFSPPARDAFLWDKDFAAFAWVANVFGGGNRTASGCLAAVVAAAVGVRPLTAIMPVIVAAYAALVCATGSLVTLRFRQNAAPLLASLWAALSAAGAYSVYDQNIDQIFGLGVLVAAVTLLATRSFYVNTASRRLGRALCAAVAIAGLTQFYPEMLAFLGVSCVITALRWLLTKRLALRTLVKSAGWVALLILGLLNLSALTPLIVFSYINVHPTWGYYDYLGASELANMWGFAGIGEPGTAALLPFGIALGGALFVALVIAVGAYARRLMLPAVIATLLLLALVYFFATQVGYSVWKTIMYLEPFALALIVVGAYDLSRRLRAGPVPIVRFAAVPVAAIVFAAVAGTNGAAYEMLRSINRFDDSTASFVAIRGSSRERLAGRLAQQLAPSKANVLVSDSPSNVLGRYEGALTAGTPLLFPSRDVVDNLSTNIVYTGFLANPAALDQVKALVALRAGAFTPATFDFAGGRASFKLDSRMPSPARLAESGAYLVTSRTQTVLNLSHQYGTSPVTLVPGSQLRNHLVFVKSSLGGHDPEDRDSAIGSARPDFMDAEDITQLLSKRSLLFAILNPTPRFRLLFGFTESPARLADQQLPSPQVFGSDVAAMNAIGAGAAQLYSPPLSARWIDGQAFLVLDVGKAPDGTFVSFARNLSLVTEQEFDARSVPSTVTKFPADLVHSGAQFSGAYEDGWIGGDAWFELRAPARAKTIFLKTENPSYASPRTVTLQVYVDGAMRAQSNGGPGNLSITTPVNLAPGIHRVELRAAPLGRLSDADGRTISLHVSSVGFESQ